MCGGGARSHFGSNPDRLHDLLSRRSLQGRAFGVAADAIGALGYMRYSNRNQLLGLLGQCAVRKNALAKRL